MRLNLQKLLLLCLLILGTTATAFSQNDLSLGVTTPAGTVAVGDTVTYTVTVNNQGATSVTGVQITNTVPAGLSLIQATPGAGTYTPATKLWDIGAIGAATASLTLTLEYKVTGEGVQTLQSRITQMTEFDGDSDPADPNPIEDDYGAACITAPFEVCQGDVINITARAPSGYSNYQWLKNGTPMAGETNDSLVITTPGDYTYTTDMSGAGSCGGGSCCPVKVVELTPPTAGITNDDATTVIDCNQTAISLTATGGASYAWSTGDNTANTSVTAAGTYTVTVTAANGCTATAQEVITEDLTAPTAAITNDDATTVITCTQTAISLTATGGGTYAWSTGASTANISVTAAGTYTVTVTSANGCTDTAQEVITEDITAPTAAITNDDATTVIDCNQTGISLTATGGGTYAWSTGASTANISVTAAGTYTVTVTAVNGCTDTAQEVITEDLTAPTAGITNDDATTEITCIQTAISLTATGGGTYAWSTGASTANISVTAAGTYTVTVTGANGCTATAQEVITGSCEVDYADLPDGTPGTGPGDYQTTSANGGPSHGIIAGLSLGANVDGEPDGQPSANGDGDDTDAGGNDDDGVVVGPTYDIVPGGTIRIPISVTNTTGNTGYLVGWIDWNGDGDFNDPGEQVVSIDDGTGPFPGYITVTVPTNATTGTDIGFITRLSNSPITSPDGYLSSGEVESHLIDVNCPSQICLPATSVKN